MLWYRNVILTCMLKALGQKKMYFEIYFKSNNSSKNEKKIWQNPFKNILCLSNLISDDVICDQLIKC